MDLVSPKFNLQQSQTLSPTSPIFARPLHSSHNSFPIIVIAIIGIFTTALLLVSYYIFVIKCCLNWHTIDILHRFSSPRRRHLNNPLSANSTATESKQGLDEKLIRAIPIFQYETGEKQSSSASECSVCLNDFQENENLKCIPNCSHIFHIDCIDVWLQSNANCPLCRNNIRYNESFMYRDEDFVVLEIGGQNGQTLPRIIQSPTQESTISEKKVPITRSFSMDSAVDKKKSYLAVEEIIQRQSTHLFSNDVIMSPCSYIDNNEMMKRSFFSFRHGRGSRSASILPIHMEI